MMGESNSRYASLTVPLSSSLYSFRIIPPEPAHCIREDRAAVIAIVSAFAEDVFVVVILIFERRNEIEVPNHPIPAWTPTAVVVRAVLHKDTNRFPIVCADDIWVFVSAADVGEAADVADNFAELVGPIPSDCPRADRTAAN